MRNDADKRKRDIISQVGCGSPWSLIGQGGMYIWYDLGDAAGRKTASPDRLCVFGGYVWYVLYVFGDAAETALNKKRPRKY